MSETVPVLCGLDIGTTYIKAALVTETGAVVGGCKEPTPVTDDGFGECHDPEAVLEVAERVVCTAQQQCGTSTAIVGIGVTTVGEEGVPLGRRGEVLYPAVAWYERRGSVEEKAWSACHSDEEFFRSSGLHKDLGLTLFKWLWLKSEQQEVWGEWAHWLGIGDYVVWRWTGEMGMSVSHAARTGVLELCSSRWREDWAQDAMPRGAGALPSVHDAGSVIGYLGEGSLGGARTAGAVPVVATGLDHVVGAHAAGALRAGRVMDSLGTAEALLAEVPFAFAQAADLSSGVDFLAGLFSGTCVASATLSSGAGIAQLFRVLGVGQGPQQKELEAAAAAVEALAGGLTYVPPRARGDAGGAVFGLKTRHDREHVYRAVIEGWAFAADDALAALGEHALAAEVLCAGGGSSSELVLGVKASLLGRELERVRTPEMVAVGAALLAGKAAFGRDLLSGWEPDCELVAPERACEVRYRSERPRFLHLAASVHGHRDGHVYP